MTLSEDAFTWPDHQAPETWLAWANGWRSLQALNMACTQLDAQHGEFVIEEVPFPPNVGGSVNGGMLAAAADQVLGVMSMVCSPGTLPATATLHISYHRPAMVPLTFHAKVLPGGSRTKFIEVIIAGAAGERCATAHGAMIARRARAARH